MTPLRALFSLFIVSAAQSAWAGGLSFLHNHARASGKGAAFTGEADDASAVFYNPAGLSSLSGTRFEAGSSAVYLDSGHKSRTTGQATRMEGQFLPVPHVYLSHRPKVLEEKLGLGFGMYHPFGLIVDWPAGWPGRFASTNSRLRATVYHPSAAFSVMPNFSLGAGVRIADISAEFGQMVPAGPPEPKVRAHDLNDTVVGWNAGVLFRPVELLSVGLHYKSPMSASLQGSADLSGMLPNTTFRTNLNLPSQTILGFSLKPSALWSVNLDLEWEDWSRMRYLTKEFDGAADALNSSGRREWRDSYGVRLGVERKCGEKFALRAGYYFDQSPIPDNTFDPTIPNADMHTLTVGTGWTKNWFSTNFAYAVGFYDRRSIDANTVDPANLSALGTLDTTAHVVTLSFGLKL